MQKNLNGFYRWFLSRCTTHRKENVRFSYNTMIHVLLTTEQNDSLSVKLSQLLLVHYNQNGTIKMWLALVCFKVTRWPAKQQTCCASYNGRFWALSWILMGGKAFVMWPPKSADFLCWSSQVTRQLVPKVMACQVTLSTPAVGVRGGGGGGGGGAQRKEEEEAVQKTLRDRRGQLTFDRSDVYYLRG